MAGAPGVDPVVTVVVPHFDAPSALDRLVAALAVQDQPHDRMELVVADDGSPEPPRLPTDLPFPARVVGQEDRGFRAAAARNLGVAAGQGDVLVFLDGDMVPAPSYVSSLAAAVGGHGDDDGDDGDDGHGVLAVGRRRHADLAGLDPVAAASFAASGLGAPVLEEPRWLAAGYARTADLADAGEEDVRLVISAVMAIDRRTFERIGGFDATFVGYGGEDWDLAWRCWVAGARLRHVPEAVAWHDGPDLAGRSADRRALKNAESLALAARVPLRSMRGHGLVHVQPRIVVRLGDPGPDPAALVVSVQSLLRDSDAGVWIEGPGSRLVPPLAGDPRVHSGPPPAEVLARARSLVTLDRPVLATRSLESICDEHALGTGVEAVGVGSVRSTRAVSRGVAVRRVASVDGLEPVPGDLDLERFWGGW